MFSMTAAAGVNRGVVQQAILARLAKVPRGLGTNEVNALLRGISDAIGFAIVMAPGSGYESAVVGAGTARMIPGVHGIPLPRTGSHVESAVNWPRKGVLAWYELSERGTRPDRVEPGPRGYPGGATFRGDNVVVFFQDPQNCIESAGWLTSIRRVNYGSPFEVIFQVAALPTVTAGVSAFLTYFLTGRASKRKTASETRQITAAATLAESQLPFAVRRASADIGLVEAQRIVTEADAVLKLGQARKLSADTGLVEAQKLETEADVALKLSQTRKVNAEIEYQEVENLRSKLDLLKDLAQLRGGTQNDWPPEVLWKMLAAPGLVEALDNLAYFDPHVEVIEDSAA